MRLCTQVPSINTMTALEELTLDGCTLLTQLQLLLPRLHSASMHACPALTSVWCCTTVE